MTDREIMQQALDALLHMCNTTKAQNDYNAKIVDKALVTLETALAQPEHKPWVGLTDEERHAYTQSPFTEENYRAIEAALRSKNT